ncbi:MAG: hypothetical protein Q4B25_00855 [Pseudomonadota bacterium]|nr:hypothetical protein [Pseudomonadota bacterium]
MFLALLRKEYFKIAWWWYALLCCNALLMGYVFMETRRLFILDHAEIVWYRVFYLDQIHYAPMRFIPLFNGLLLGFAQFLPEMNAERMRLSLHLPLSSYLVMLGHLCVGLLAVLLTICLDFGLLGLITARYFPWEAVCNAAQTFLPWAGAGVAAYLGSALVLLEPSFRLRVCNLALSAGACGFFLRQAAPGGYVPALFFLGLMLALMLPAVLLPAYRFRFRRVDV